VSITRMSLFTVLVLSLSSFASAGYAQDDIRKKGDRACGGDSRRMCTKSFQGGDMAVLGCLQQNKVRLSGSCRRFLTEIGQLY
jgi:hypothetical protein